MVGLGSYKRIDRPRHRPDSPANLDQPLEQGLLRRGRAQELVGLLPPDDDFRRHSGDFDGRDGVASYGEKATAILLASLALGPDCRPLARVGPPLSARIRSGGS